MCGPSPDGDYKRRQRLAIPMQKVHLSARCIVAGVLNRCHRIFQPALLAGPALLGRSQEAESFRVTSHFPAYKATCRCLRSGTLVSAMHLITPWFGAEKQAACTQPFTLGVGVRVRRCHLNGMGWALLVPHRGCRLGSLHPPVRDRIDQGFLSVDEALDPFASEVRYR